MFPHVRARFLEPGGRSEVVGRRATAGPDPTRATRLNFTGPNSRFRMISIGTIAYSNHIPIWFPFICDFCKAGMRFRPNEHQGSSTLFATRHFLLEVLRHVPSAVVEEIHDPGLVQSPTSVSALSFTRRAAEGLCRHGLLAREQGEEVGGEGLAVASRGRALLEGLKTQPGGGVLPHIEDSCRCSSAGIAGCPQATHTALVRRAAAMFLCCKTTLPV